MSNCPKCGKEMNLRESLSNDKIHFTGYIYCEQCSIMKIVYKNWGECQH
jgi:DNA-directed RNA polymerase subunit RPC12/RpoP